MTQAAGKRGNGVLFIMCATVFWGSMGFFVRTLHGYGFDSVQIAGMRLTIGAVIFGIMTVFRLGRKGFRIAKRDIFLFVLLGICSILFFTCCYFLAIEWLPLSTAAILLYTSPIWVMILSVAFLREKLTGKKLLALAAAFAGCVCVSGISSGMTWRGLVAGLAAGLGYGLYSIWGSIALKKYGTLTVTACAFAFAAAGSWLIRSPVEIIRRVSQSEDTAFLVLFIVCTAILTANVPYYLYTKGLESVRPDVAAIYATMEPVVAALLGIVLYNEPAGVRLIIGMLLVLAAVFLLSVGNRRSN